MKIVHIAPNAPYNDYWGYQDNLLPKYQKKLGHDVTMIVTNTCHKDGEIVEIEPADYRLSDGVRVIRLPIRRFKKRFLTGWHSHMKVLPHLEALKPDLIFYHGLVSTTIFEAIRYKKKSAPDCVIVQDNHMDYNIGHKSATLKQKLTRLFFRTINRRSIGQVTRVYGVTPWRKHYAEDYFKIPPTKTDILIMGADDEMIDLAHKQTIRQRIRTQYKIADDEFLIVTGGKIDQKKQIDTLMRAVGRIKGVRLLIFGRVQGDVKDTFDTLLRTYDNLTHIGWIAAERVYDYFFAADLVFFPGQHSVLWEQACAAKVPCVFQKWEGMDHVNNGGNSVFLEDISEKGIGRKIETLRFTEAYEEMKRVAESSKTDIYLYSRIAEKSLECLPKYPKA